MKYLTRLLLPLLFSSNLFASDLCDSSCALSITFPDGGSIKAVKDIGIEFGTGGYITNNGVTTGYSKGEDLELDSGESIVFRTGGILVLGEGGNVDHSEMTISSNGVMNLAAVGGKKKVEIRDLNLLGELTLNMSSDFTVTKSRLFYIESGSVVALTDLVFKNDGYVYGQFVFGDAILIQGRKQTEFSGAVFLESYQKFKIISVVAVDEPVIEEPPEVVEPPVVPVDTVGEVATTDSATSESAIEPTAYGSASGFISMLSLMTVSTLLLFVRRYTVY
jgi:hypothetical protein